MGIDMFGNVGMMIKGRGGGRMDGDREKKIRKKNSIRQRNRRRKRVRLIKI